MEDLWVQGDKREIFSRPIPKSEEDYGIHANDINKRYQLVEDRDDKVNKEEKKLVLKLKVRAEKKGEFIWKRTPVIHHRRVGGGGVGHVRGGGYRWCLNTSVTA